MMGSRLLFYAGFVVMAAAFVAVYWLPYILNGQLLPFGWDTPFYIWKERILFTEDVATAIALQSPRVGYSLYLGLVHAAGFTDVLLAQKVAGTYLAFLLLLANGLFCYLLFKRKAVIFPLTFLVGISTYGFWRLNEDLYDNVLAMVAALTMICITLLTFGSKRQKIAIVLLVVMVMAVTHLETLAMLAIGGFVYFIVSIRSYSSRQVVSLLAAVILFLGMVVLLWLPELGPFLATYKPQMNLAVSWDRLQAVNLFAVPARTVGSISGFIIFVLYIPFVLYGAIRRIESHKILFSWLMAVSIAIGLNVALYSFTIPVHRLVLFLPIIPVMVGMLFLIYTKAPQKWLGSAVIVLVLVPGFASPLKYQATRTSFLTPGSQQAMIYLSHNTVDALVPAQYELEHAGAYYGNWQNWLWATGPYGSIGKTQLYNGSLIEYKQMEQMFLTTSDTAQNVGFDARRTLLFKEFSAHDYTAFADNSVRLSENVSLTNITLDNHEDIIAPDQQNPWTIQSIGAGGGEGSRPAGLSHGPQAEALVVALKSTAPQHITLAEVSLIDDKDNLAYFPIASSDIRADWKKLVLRFPDDTKVDLSRIVRVKINVYTRPGTTSDLQVGSLAAWHFSNAKRASILKPAPGTTGNSFVIPPGVNRLNIIYRGSQQPEALLEIKKIGQGGASEYVPVGAYAPGMQYIDVPVRPGMKVQVSGSGFKPKLEKVRAYKDVFPAQND